MVMVVGLFFPLKVTEELKQEQKDVSSLTYLRSLQKRERNPEDPGGLGSC